MSVRFDILPTPIAGLQVLQRKPLGDNRGYLERMFCSEELGEVLAGRQIVQVNHTLTANRGTVRGLHFQHPPHAEIKIVSCLVGAVFDVAVDLRHNSPTYLHWHAEILSADNHKSLFIPEGCAHGFQTLADHCHMLYLHTQPYHAPAEGGLNVADPALAIAWPLPVIDLSSRDSSHAMISDDFIGFDID